MEHRRILSHRGEKQNIRGVTNPCSEIRIVIKAAIQLHVPCPAPAKTPGARGIDVFTNGHILPLTRLAHDFYSSHGERSRRRSRDNRSRRGGTISISLVCRGLGVSTRISRSRHPGPARTKVIVGPLKSVFLYGGRPIKDRTRMEKGREGLRTRNEEEGSCQAEQRTRTMSKTGKRVELKQLFPSGRGERQQDLASFA